MATTKGKAKKKGSGPPTGIDVEIDLVGFKATAAQRAQLRALVKNQVLTWATTDLGAPNMPVHCLDKPGNGNGE